MADDDDGLKTTKISTTKAKDRLEQIASHVSAASAEDVQEPEDGGVLRKANVSRRRRKKSAENELRADYGDILSQITTLRTMATTPDLSRPGYVRQKQSGKLWVRERVEQMFDKGTVQEIGSVSGTVKWRANPQSQKNGQSKGQPDEEVPESFVPSNNVQGLALLGGRKVCFTADDYSLRAGHADGALWEKTVSYVPSQVASRETPTCAKQETRFTSRSYVCIYDCRLSSWWMGHLAGAQSLRYERWATHTYRHSTPSTWSSHS